MPVITFTATDADADGDETIAGYLITETSAKPSASAGGWTPTAPTQYVTSSVGTLTLYAWAKDDKDAVSNSRSDMVTIPQPPINADTLDGKHAADLASTIHSHTVSDVSGLAAALSGKADAIHTHSGADIVSGTIGVDKLESYAGVRLVHKGPADGVNTFITIASALDAITDNSATNHYAVFIMPGAYVEQVVVKPYVDLIGASRTSTIITSAQEGVTVSLTSHNTLQNLTIASNRAGERFHLGTAVDMAMDSNSLVLGCDVVVSGNSTGIQMNTNNSIEDVRISIANYVFGYYNICGSAISAQSMADDPKITIENIEVLGNGLTALSIDSFSTLKPIRIRNVAIRGGFNAGVSRYSATGLGGDVSVGAVDYDQIIIDLTGCGTGLFINNLGSDTMKSSVVRHECIDPIRPVINTVGDLRIDNSTVKGPINIYYSDVFIANSQIDLPFNFPPVFNQTGKAKVVNCFDRNFDPIPNGLYLPTP